MTTTDFTSTIIVDKTPAEVFDAVTNVRGWWSEEIEGNTSKINDVFNYHYEDMHRCKMKLIEVIPNEVIVWHVLENYFSFIEDDKEWTDDKVIFEITKVGDKTQLQMTHVGLTPQNECYKACNDGWTYYIQTSLKSLIETGKGMPNAKDTARTETEKKLSGK
ncbi:SRPBCC family protein [Flavobacterium wongokense]|uniref:SRPBCC family protein n=1 Tax=Flavobacterium wongokense TaxID=2910674 RepID=UPI001F1B0A78|nr:SRPBCC domain-containing protein [Flavobacterium sp. WG47]MCF6130739.1 SRPBCC domain-containing protein [Flavobacterium sp. WG47]